jgi:hypothetical protein
MSTLPALHRSLVEAARRIERQDHASPSRRWRPVRLRWRQSVILFALMLVGGSAAGAVIAINGTRSKPLQGHVPGVIPGPLGGRPRLSGVRYRIRVFPYMQVGWSGWCSSVVLTFHRTHVRGNYVCSGQATPPVLTAGGTFLSDREQADYLVVSPNVAAVRFPDGQLIQPVADAGLPAGWRVVVHVGPLGKRVVRIVGPAGGPPVRYIELPVPQVPTLLDANGKPIHQHEVTRANAVYRLAIRTISPASPTSVPCSAHLQPTAGIQALNEQVATLPAHPAPTQAETLTSCASASFLVDGHHVDVAVLVNARDARATPPALPGTRAASDTAGLFTGRALGNLGYSQGLASDIEGPDINPPTATATDDITARRAGSAWLIAQGSTTKTRAKLLHALTIDKP